MPKPRPYGDEAARTAELKNRTNELLHEVEDGQVPVVTRRGKPVAAIHACHEEDLEDLMLLTNPSLRCSIERAEKDLRAGRGLTLRVYKKRIETAFIA
jgi:antitoxin (DNA-binding transcriptional repressor) of toxin-antitoxin stability system